MQEVFSKVQPLDYLTCSQGKSAKLLCCAKNCQNYACVCRFDQCACLPKAHQLCQFVYASSLINKVLNKKKQIPETIIKAADKIQQIYEQAIQKLSRDLDSLRLWRDNFGLTADQTILLDSMMSNDQEKLTGSLIFKVKQNIQKKVQMQWLDLNWVDKFWKEEQTQFNKIFYKVNWFYRQFNLDKKNKRFQKFQSNVWKDPYVIANMFVRPIKDFNLLYRASENNFSAQEFHKKCDGIPNTLVLITTQFGKNIGGYTPLPWRSSASGSQIQADTLKQSFIFNLTTNQKYELINPSIAIAHNSVRGPMFGQGRDICICNKANTQKGSFCNFPYSYNNGKYVNGQAAHTSITGCQKGYYMLLKEWQVFQVQWQQL